jgi:hypothetical protein
MRASARALFAQDRPDGLLRVLEIGPLLRASRGYIAEGLRAAAAAEVPYRAVHDVGVEAEAEPIPARRVLEAVDLREGKEAVELRRYSRDLLLLVGLDVLEGFETHLVRERDPLVQRIERLLGEPLPPLE